MAMSKTQFIQWRKAAKKPELTSAQLDGRYKAYLKRTGGTKAKAKTVVNDRPDGWAKEGVKVTATNRHLYPASKWEVVEGQNGTKWARQRTELTGIDPELHGLVSTYDTDTNKQVGQMKRVYDALGTQLTQEAQASQARLGGLAELAGRSVPASYQSGAVSTPSGGMVQAPVQANANGADTAAIQQRMLLRDAALDVNTANLDAQQASQTGTRLVSKLQGERAKGRSDLLQSLVLKTREDAAAAREANLQLLGQQLDADADAAALDAKLSSQEKQTAAKIESSERIAGAKITAQQQAQAAKKKAATSDAKVQRDLMNKYMPKRVFPGETVADPNKSMVPGYENIPNWQSAIVNVQVNAEGNPVPNTGTPVPVYISQMVTRGMRPMNAIRLLMASGWKGSQSDAYHLLTPFLGNKRAMAAAKQLGLPTTARR